MHYPKLERMKSSDLSPAQAAAVGKIIRQHLRYLGKLRSRMEHLGFPGNDLLYFDVCRVFDMTQALRMNLHYLSCSSGVGMPRKDGPHKTWACHSSLNPRAVCCDFPRQDEAPPRGRRPDSRGAGGSRWRFGWNNTELRTEITKTSV
jgi:hypothetical protein